MLRKPFLLLFTALLGACAIPERVTPIPVRPLAIKTDCSYRDETGTSGMLKLDVAAAHVRAFEARVNYPQHGVCHFALKDFRQTKELPAIELTQQNGSCIVRMWEQGARVTVAFQQCERMCTGSASEQLLPIIYDRRDGTCA